jgi:hypothetical protein
MTLTSLLAFVSGAAMARFKEPTLDDRDHRIEELETVCNRLTATLRATTEQLLNTRLENEALRINLYGVQARPLSAEQQAEFARQFGEQRNPQTPRVPGRADMLREYDRVFGLPRPRDPQLQMQAGLAYPVPGQVQRELSEFTENWRSCTCVPSRADMLGGLGAQGAIGSPPNEWEGITGPTGYSPFLRDPRSIPE